MTGREGALPLLFRLADGIGRIDPDGLAGAEDRDALPETPDTLADFQADPAPHILFPPDGAEVWADRAGRGFILSAQADGELSWYADGARVEHNAVGEPVWYPPGPGFYSVTAIDRQGRLARSRVRILSEG